MNESLIPNVRAYAFERQLQIAERLGSGKDGIVLVGRSRADPARVAIKAHRFTELYLREKAVYQRLAKMAVITVLGFNLPQLLAAHDTLRVLEMTIVKRPFVLDFAGAYLDVRPEFPAEVWADWEMEKREQFEGAGGRSKGFSTHLKKWESICWTCPPATLPSSSEQND